MSPLQLFRDGKSRTHYKRKVEFCKSTNCGNRYTVCSSCISPYPTTDFMDAKKVRPIGTHRKSVSPDCCYTIIYPFNGYRKKKKTLFAKVFSHERNRNMSLCSVFIIPPFCANVNNLWNIYSETKKVPKHLFWIIDSQDTDGLYAEGKISSSPRSGTSPWWSRRPYGSRESHPRSRRHPQRWGSRGNWP